MNKKIIAGIAIYLMLLFGVGYGLYQAIQQISEIQNATINLEIHCDMYHYRDGILIKHSHHAGVLTNTGKDFIEGKIGNSAFANNTVFANYISLSNSTDSPSATWVILPDEITTGTMARTLGTYVSTGVGTWNVSKSFSPSETNSTRLVGLNWNSTGNNLMASDTISAINYESGDTVEIVWSITAS